MKKVFRFLIFLMPIVVFIVWVWVIFVQLKSDFVVEIETLISESKWEKALKNIESELSERPDYSMHLYLLGSVAIFGLEQEKNYKRQKQTKYPDYKYELIRRDPTGLFLRESFIYKFKQFAQSEKIIELVCEYIDYFPNNGHNEVSFQKSFHLILSHRKSWLYLKPDCFDNFFKAEWRFLDSRKFVVKSRAILRAKPHQSSRIVKVLKSDEVVIRLNDTSSSNDKNKKKKEDHYFYIVDKKQKSGWSLKEKFRSF